MRKSELRLLIRECIAEELNEAREIKLPVKAKDNHGHKYDVVIAYRNGKPILNVKGTPGTWYIDTLKKHRGNILSIDSGQGWDLINFNEVFKAAINALKK
jgi:hypothetical protein